MHHLTDFFLGLFLSDDMLFFGTVAFDFPLIEDLPYSRYHVRGPKFCKLNIYIAKFNSVVIINLFILFIFAQITAAFFMSILKYFKSGYFHCLVRSKSPIIQ